MIFSKVKNVKTLEGIGVSAEYDNDRHSPVFDLKRTPKHRKTEDER